MPRILVVESNPKVVSDRLEALSGQALEQRGMEIQWYTLVRLHVLAQVVGHKYVRLYEASQTRHLHVQPAGGGGEWTGMGYQQIIAGSYTSMIFLLARCPPRIFLLHAIRRRAIA